MLPARQRQHALFREIMRPNSLCGRSRRCRGNRIQDSMAPESHVSQYIESLGTKGLDTRRLDTTSPDIRHLGLPAARMPAFVGHLYRPVRKLLRSIIARIDLSQFPGSCCG